MTRWIVAIVAVAVLLIAGITVVAVAVSGSDSDDEASAAEAPTDALAAPDPEEIEEFQQCLEEHGVEPPGERFGAGDEPPDPGSMPEPSAEMLEAAQACRELMPTPPGGFGDRGGPGFLPIPQN